jgi:hypothetical protein
MQKARARLKCGQMFGLNDYVNVIMAGKGQLKASGGDAKKLAEPVGALPPKRADRLFVSNFGGVSQI